jgi:hypothetical protein
MSISNFPDEELEPGVYSVQARHDHNSFLSRRWTEKPLKRLLRIRQATTGLKAGVNDNQIANSDILSRAREGIRCPQSKISSPTGRPPK